MIKKVLALDPGLQSGYSIIGYSNENKDYIQLFDYGIIPILYPGTDGLIKSVYDWLDNWIIEDVEMFSHIVFEDMQITKGPSLQEAHEVRGVIRSFCNEHPLEGNMALTPYTVREQLGILNSKNAKREVKDFVSRVFGFTPPGPDHCHDSMGVNIAYAIKENLWIPHLQPIPPPKTRKASVQKTQVAQRMSAAEYAQAVADGRIG